MAKLTRVTDWLVKWKSSLVGAVERLLHDKLDDSISVKDFGAKMDGVSDDTAALTLAFNSGRPIHFPTPEDATKYCVVSDTIKIPSNANITGAGSNIVVIKCSPSMPANKHTLVTSNYASGVSTANTNIVITDLCVDSNGYNRSGSKEGFGLTINAEDTIVSNCTFLNSPKWNLFVTSANPFVEVGHATDNTAPSKNITISGFTSVDPIAGDGALLQGVWGARITDYNSLYTPALTGKVRNDTGIQFIEGCRDIVFDGGYFDHNNTITTAVGISSHANKQHLRDIVVRDVYGVGLSTLVGVYNDPSVVPVTSPDWRTKGLLVENCTLDYPVNDAASTVMQSRLVDVQNMHNVIIRNVTVNLTKPDGTYNAPTSVVNMGGARNVTIDGVRINGAPVVSGTLPIARTNGWITLRDANCSNIRIKDLIIENTGYYNRMISDSVANTLKAVDGLLVMNISADGQTKEGIVSGSQALKLENFSLPTGMSSGRVTSIFTAIDSDNMDVRQSSPRRYIGGVQARAINAGGAQTSPTLVLERGYVGSGGKGNLAFWTSTSTLGTLGVGAWDESTQTFTPIHVTAYQPSNSTTKYLSPAVNGDTNLGNASAAWLNIYSVNAAQTTCDRRKKSKVRKLTGAEVSAGLDIIQILGIWTWLDGRGDRLHAGTTVQDVMEVMESHGLAPFDYSFICYSSWEDEYQVVWDVDGEGQEVDGTRRSILIKEAGDEYSFRVQELHMFLLACVATTLITH